MKTTRRFASVIALSLVAAACSDSSVIATADEGSSGGDVAGESVPVGISDFEVNDDGELWLFVDSCGVPLDVEVVEDETSIVVSVSQFIPPPVTNDLGELEVVTDACQDAIQVELAQPIGQRQVIDGNTDSPVDGVRLTSPTPPTTEAAFATSVPATVGPNGADEVADIVVDGFSISDLNNAVQAFLPDRLAADDIRIEYSVGISVEDRESPTVVVGMEAATRERADVALVEQDLQRFVDSLVSAEDNVVVDEVFEIRTTGPVLLPESAPVISTQGPNAFNSPTRIGAFEGLAVEEAEDAALAAGWEFVDVRDIDFDEFDGNGESAGRPADYLESLLGLYVEDGVVIEAWSGGYRVASNEPLGDVPLRFEGYELSTNNDQELSLDLEACHPDGPKSQVTETANQVVITLTQVAQPPPTTNELGEEDVQNDCQSSLNVRLQEPLDQREVIDGNTGRVADFNG